MTKRFTIDEHSNLNKLDDNLKEEFYIIANGFDASQLCDLLNGLDEENKQLKTDFLFKDELIQQLEKTNLHLNHELRLKNDNVLELEKENEQLKSENNMLKVTIGRNEAYIKRLTEKSDWRTSAYD